MHKEIEAKFINIDKDGVISKLEQIGAKKVFDERLLRRRVYDMQIPVKDSWARVRDEVDKVTMSFKRVSSHSLDGVEEVELIIDDFENGCKFLRSLGLVEKAYQETKRMRYALEKENVIFDIDTWPALNPWIEIESDSEAKVKEYAFKLGFNWEDAMFGSAGLVYTKVYKIDEAWINLKCPVLKFDELPGALQPSNLRIMI